MAKSLTVLLAALLLLFAFSSATRAEPASTVRKQEVFGWLVRHGNAWMLQTDNGDYIVAGRDLTGLKGKMVEITGTISEDERGYTIYVEAAREVDE